MVPLCYNSSMPIEQAFKTSFSTTASRHTLARAVAAKLHKRDLSELINYLLQREIDKYLTPETQQDLLASDDHNPEREAAREEKPTARPKLRYRKAGADARRSPRDPTTTETEDGEATG